MNRGLFLILLIGLLVINVNSLPKRENYKYLDRHVSPLHVRKQPGRWYPDRNHRHPHVPKVDPEPIVDPHVDPHVDPQVDPHVDPQPEPELKRPTKLVCYLGSWANYRPGDGRFVMEDIDANLCTHLIYGFAKLENNRITMFDEWLDSTENWGLGGYARFNSLRQQNPGLKTIIALGGWNEGSEKYSEMARNAVTRAIFVQSVVEFLKKHDFNGLDFDWEYPANRGGIPEDKANFVQCLRELRAAFDAEGKGWLLTSAVSAGRATIETAYDIPEMSRLCDIINLMGYDFHGAWHDYTGHNAPLFVKPTEPEDEKIMNINFAVDYWLAEGADPQKITLGMPIYGRTFTLIDASNNGFYANTSGPGLEGPYTREAGMIGYHEICSLLKTEAGLWRTTFDNDYLVPYTVKDKQWIGFDNEESIEIKARYVIAKGLGGGMIWSLDTDDFRGHCGQGRFPILRHIKNTLATGTALPLPPVSGPQPTQPPPTQPPATEAPATEAPATEAPATEAPATQPPATQPPPQPTEGPSTGFECKAVGYFRHPETCEKYYECVQNIQSNGAFHKYERVCAPGTLFSTKLSICNFANQIDDCVDGKPVDAKHSLEPKSVRTNANTGDPRCKEAGIFRNENECRSFVICKENPFVDGHKFIVEEQYCPDGLVFDDNTKTCNNRQFVERCNKVVKV